MPEVPITRAQAIALAGVAIAVALLVGRVLLPAGGASSEDGARLRVSSAARGSAAAGGGQAGVGVVVHVVGAVRRPGLYRLAAGSRVADALAQAGGAAAAADVALVNLAAPLADGQQVVVPTRAAAGGGGSGARADGEGSADQGPVHLNTASLSELDALPGVGPVTAQKIVDYREKHGAFSSLEDLDAIPGIGAAKIEQLRDLVAP